MSAPACCLDCPHHVVVVQDPDPDDWFCDDDVAVLCGKTPNTTGRKFQASKRLFPNRVVTNSCRPYNMRRDSKRPDWCPVEGGR